MKTFIALIKINIKICMEYKVGFLFSLIIHPFILLLNIAVFTSIYSYNNVTTVMGYSLPQIIWYFGSIPFVWVFIWNFTDENITTKVLSGDLAMDLLRPVSLFRFELADAIGLRSVGVLLEFLPGIIVYSILYFPVFMTPLSMLKFFAVILLSFLLFFLLNFLIGMSAFVLKNNSSIYTIKFIIFSALGGAYIPLNFFPEPMYKVLSLLPFQYIFYWPVQFFLNLETTQGINIFIKTIAFQLMWIVVLYALCKLIWSRAVKKFCSVGG